MVKKFQNTKVAKNAPKIDKGSKKTFKTKNGPSGSVKSEGSAWQLEDDVPDFPRGKSSIKRRQKDEIHADTDGDYEFEERDSRQRKGKKMQKKGHTLEDDLGSLFGNGITGKLPRFANNITFKNITQGMKLWGVITEVNEKDLVVSLPGGLRGLVRACDAFDSVFGNENEETEGNFLPSIFHTGQLVSCTVVQLDDDKKDKGKRKIWLSLRLSLLQKGFTFDAVQEGMVLTAHVKSIEDHGYILHFGLSSFTGFLPKSSRADSKEVEVKPGQLLQGVVRRIDKARKVVYLISDQEIVSKFVTKDLKGISIDLLVPGMMVNASIKSTLENGILLSFLTYFTGTVDLFHLENTFPSTNWKDDYHQNKKVNARILFIDPSTRAVGLTLNPHLVHNKAPPSHVRTGDIYDNSKVVRVDNGSGLLLEVSSVPVSTPAYVRISDVAEEDVQKFKKKFKEGSHVRARILGFRHLEGLATGILKASAFEDSVFTHSDVKPGMIVKAKIIAVDNFGAIVQFPGGVKALCPLRHMSEFEIAKPRKKFKVGAELTFRVLGCKSKRITVTHKKTLVKSKLGILSSYADATSGLITHGWITKIEKHGCFVRFYNGVQGFASRFELGLQPGNDPNSMYHVGEVVKCRVIRSVAASKRINLSLMMTPTSIPEDDAIQLGSIVSGVVDEITPSAVVVYVNVNGYSKGIVSTEHLADNHGLATLMKSVLKPEYRFEELLVLDIKGNNLILSAKYSLINLAGKLPINHSQIHPHSVVHGYICNLIDTGCFIRFLGHLTGFSPRHKALDDQKTDLSEAFFIGQSVRSNILDVNNETSRITVSLKQSSCCSTDASFLQGYFLLEEKIAKLQSSGREGAELTWVEGFNIGSVIEGKIQEAKDIGVVVSFGTYNDVFGFITQYQLGGTSVQKDTVVRALVLDVAKTERLVDLSLKPEFIDKLTNESQKNQSQKKKRKREAYKNLEVHQKIKAVVEIVKENYLVLSIPEYNHVIGFASIFDYNTQKFPRRQFLNGQGVDATVMALPSSSTGGRLLLLLECETNESSSSKRAKKKSSYDVGSLVQAEITEIKPLELRLKFGIGLRGRIHITELSDSNESEQSINNFKIGEMLTAKIVAKVQREKSKKSYQWELSIKSALLSGDKTIIEENSNFSTGQRVTGYVYKVDNEWVWLTISRDVRAQLFILDTSCEPSELQEFQKSFYVGKAISGYVLCTNKDRNLLRLFLHPFVVASNRNLDGHSNLDDQSKSILNETGMSHIHVGDIVGGRISRKLPGVSGLVVQVGPRVYGKVHFTEITDSWESDPSSGYSEGQFVKCKVLEVSRSVKGTVHIDLSLRSSLDGLHFQNSVEPCNNLQGKTKRVETIEDLQANMIVQGYVKDVTPKGCFILLSRKLDAKVLISNLSDGFVEAPEKDFPVGKLVTGRVVSVEPLSKRVEVTLKTLNASNTSKSKFNDLSLMNAGEIVSGRVKRVEPYGLFITIDHTNIVGLCHVSELSDDHLDNIDSKFKVGERVKAKILKVDKERQRISLGMKSSYITEEIKNKVSMDHESEEDEGKFGVLDESIVPPDSNCPGIQTLQIDYDNGECPVFEQVESRSSIPPLDVSLDEMESDMNIVVSEDQEKIEKVHSPSDKNKRESKKRAKEEREREITAAEERLLETDIPRTADEYEKVVRCSPNSSLIWIKYMAFMLSMADVDKARSIAERALRTINIREENEKLNVWVAYFNLENEYGSPPEEAVVKVFQRALQYLDTKKVHLALLGMYERTEQHKLADELLDKMVKKFKHSCKVWLRLLGRFLKQNQDGVPSVVNRALLSLPRHKHIKFISQTAILEFKCGVPDRGRSMFEGILREYPKRIDLWNVYIDQEIRLGNSDLIRALFERAISLSLPPKKMKSLFKKYAEYEESVGDEERRKSVTQKAMDYVKSALV